MYVCCIYILIFLICTIIVKIFFRNIFSLCLTSQRNSGWVVRYIYVHDRFDVCSWVQTHLVQVWDCVRGRVHVCVCGSSSGLLKACWEACHCKSGKGKSPKCTEERTHHPPLSLSVSLSPLLPRSFLFSLSLIYKTPHLVVAEVLWKCNLLLSHPLLSPPVSCATVTRVYAFKKKWKVGYFNWHSFK